MTLKLWEDYFKVETEVSKTVELYAFCDWAIFVVILENNEYWSHFRVYGVNAREKLFLDGFHRSRREKGVVVSVEESVWLMDKFDRYLKFSVDFRRWENGDRRLKVENRERVRELLPILKEFFVFAGEFE